MTHETELEILDDVSDSLNADEDAGAVADETVALKIKRSDFRRSARRGR